ncbi:hypothetical protein Q3G72_025691 [Acer saccharum]|nr:hypothetical protein Q3G72_025691 [Acer saccharum]
MSLLRKLPIRFLNPQSALRLRFFTAQTAEKHAFPDVPTSAYYDECINAAGRDGDLETIRKLLNKRIADGCFNTNNTFKFLTRTESSLSILDDLFETLARLDRGLPRKQAYDALIARLCKIKRVEDSLRLVDAMARGNDGLNAVTFHPILSRLTHDKKMEEAWRVIGQMRQLKVSPDLTAYNYLLTANCFNGNLMAASEVLERIEEDQLGLDARTYDALVMGACKEGKVEGALLLVRRMLDDGQSPLYCTYAHVISALLKLDYCAQAVKFVMVCGNRDHKLDTESFGCLASRLIGMRKFDEAKFVLEEMNKRGLEMYGSKLKDFYESNVRNAKLNSS